MTATAPSIDVRAIPVARCEPNPWNRKTFDPEKLKELADSIFAQGLLQPIVVRPHPTKTGTFQIVAGERRWRAVKQKKLATIDASVREMNDVELVELLAIENGQREDDPPLEEAARYRFLRDRGEYDVRAIASKVGKSPSYVYHRLKLLELIPAAQKLLEQAFITPAHAVLLARLQPADQEAAIAEFHTRGIGFGPVADLEAWIRDEVNQALGSVAFSTTDPELVSEAGPCTTCPKRSGYAPDLFPDLGKRDVCMDRACFQQKMTAHIAQQQAKYKDKGEPLVRIAESYTRRNGGVDPHLWKDAKKTTPGAQRAIVVSGSNRGKLKWVKVDKPKRTPRSRRSRERWDPAEQQRLEKIRKAVLAERLPEFRDAVQAVVQDITLPDDVVLFVARALRYSDDADWIVNDRRAARLDYDLEKSLEEMLIFRSPGKWKTRGWGVELPLDAAAARFAICLAIWLARDAGALEKELKAEVAKRAKADAQQQNAAATKAESLTSAKKRKPTAKATDQQPTSKKTHTTKKTAATSSSKKALARKKKGTRKKSQPMFLKPLQPSEALAAIVGTKPLPRTEITKKVWAYIKKCGLQEKTNPRLINANVTLAPVFNGKEQVSMFELTKLINAQLHEVA